MNWTENESGPDCACGNPTVVKLLPNGNAVLLCVFHTQESGLYTPLPAQQPDNWPTAKQGET